MSDPDDDGLDTIRGILNAVLFTTACAANWPRRGQTPSGSAG